MSGGELRFGVFHLFCGIGGGALGFQQAREEWGGLRGRFRTLGGVDCDAEACADFEALTGVAATRLDLFTRGDYTAFHGQEPPRGWREATPADIRAAAGGACPDVVFTSSPCKGLSALLPKAQADSPRYEALNRLTVRGIRLTAEAWADDPPSLIIFENVPRITSRGQSLLDRSKGLLHACGYEVADGIHDVGEVGGLAQHRRRYLLVARHAQKVPSFLYHPPRQKVRAIGSVLSDLPLPDDPVGGPLHRLPRLAWLTWVRLALIPAGGDWRDLQGVEPGSYRIEPAQCPHFNHVMRVTGWEDPAGAVTGAGRPAQGAIAVADPRLPGDHRRGHYRVVRWEEPSRTVTGQTGNLGSNAGMAVADPRLGHAPRRGVFQVALWEEPAHTVVGAASVRGSNGVAAVADPRLQHLPRDGSYEGAGWNEPARTINGATVSRSNGPAAVADPRLVTDNPGRHTAKFRVQPWQEHSGTVTGSDPVGSGAPVVADPRVPDRPTRRAGDLPVRGWSDPAGTITGEDSVGSGGQSVADPRLGCAPHSGAYGVLAWDGPAGAVTGAGDVHSQGAAAVADPRLPEDTDSGMWVIVAEDGTWHRPLTTLELAALQGFPTHMPDGRPLALAGGSQARWRERIGNAVPPPAARAVAGAMLQALIPSTARAWALSTYGTSVWVRMLWRVAAALQVSAARRRVPRSGQRPLMHSRVPTPA